MKEYEPPPEPEDDEFDRLFALYYDELRDIARRHLRHERSGHTLQTTALVHEAYAKLSARAGPVEWPQSANFLAFVSKAMRHVLVDHARARQTAKRGGGATQVTLQPGMGPVEAESVDLLALDGALAQLERYDRRLVRSVECRFFGGMTARETAASLGVSLSTVERDWTRAKVYLRRLLDTGPAAT